MAYSNPFPQSSSCVLSFAQSCNTSERVSRWLSAYYCMFLILRVMKFCPKAPQPKNANKVSQTCARTISGKRHGTVVIGLEQPSSLSPPPRRWGQGLPSKHMEEVTYQKKIGLLIQRRKGGDIAWISERQPTGSAALTYNP